MTTTTVAMTESTRPFRPRLLAALLAISLALNFCFIGGAVWTRLSPPQPLSASERFQRLLFGGGPQSHQQTPAAGIGNSHQHIA